MPHLEVKLFSLLELVGLPAVAASLAVVDDFGGFAVDAAQFGTLGAAMFTAYRVTAKASRDAAESARRTAKDAQDRLTSERESWAVERQAYLEQIRDLSGSQD